MKISGLKKSSAILSYIFISAVTFGLFYAYNSINNYSGSGSVQLTSVLQQDTIPKKNADPQDSIFRACMVSADKYYNEKAYEKCLSELIKARQAKPNESSLNERIVKLNGLIATQKQLLETSQKTVASGDAYFKVKDYLNAKAAYQQAVSQNPDDAIAQEKLRKTLDLLRSQKAQNILFDVAVAGADKLFQAGDLVKAQLEYENASKLLPGDPYPKSKINEIIKMQVDRQVKDEEYAKVIVSADKFYGVKNFQDALLDYKKAGSIKPGEKYPQDRIKELTQLLAEQKAKDDAYNKAIAMADLSFKNTQYPEALKSYKDALVIKPGQVYPTNKIREIEGILARVTTAQADYDNYIALADSFYIDKKYFKARENYLMATSVKPGESYPKEMVLKADRMLTGQEAAMAKALEEQYAGIIAGADKLLADKSYEPARAEYTKASNLKPAEKYPKDKIQEIGETLANAMKNKDEQYKMSIASGDKALADRLLDIARTEFQQALTIKPNEAYPKSKISEIDGLIATMAKQKALDDEYSSVITIADKLMADKTYDKARLQYQAALKLKSAEQYPKEKITGIDKALAELALVKDRDSKYAALIANGDKLLSQKSYAPARTDYTNALAFKSQETYPKEKIAEIDAALALIAKQKELDDTYTGIIAGADKLLAAKTYDQARSEYQKAGDVKPAENYPKEKIAVIDKILADIEATKSLDENYKAAVAKADQLMTEKNFDLARNDYIKASGLKPAEQYPKTKMAEIDATLAAMAKQKALDDEYAAAISNGDKLLADKTYDQAKSQYQAALKIRPAEQYPKEKITGIDKALAELALVKDRDSKFAALIANGDKLLSQKSYAPARTEYTSALALKPQETYPKEKIAEIDAALALIAKQKELDDTYAGIITGADKLLAAKTYDQARSEYQKAGDVKPAENYPKEKIAVIDKILADIEATKSLDENYKAAVAKADQLMTEKSFDLARNEYTKASGLKPAEQYPKTKLAEIDATLAAMAKQKALDDEYASAISNGDKLLADKTYDQAKSQYQAALKIRPAEQYPKDKIAETDKALAELAKLKAIDEKYAASVAAADNLLSQKSYNPAKAEYLNASALKPVETYPKEKIAEIDAALALIAKQKELDDTYAGIITGADKLLAAKTYDQARIKYQDAGKLKPSEKYPADKIAEIDKILSDIAAQNKLDADYRSTIIKADQLLTSKSYEQAKTEYTNASGLKPAEEYPKIKIAAIDLILAANAKQKALDDEYATTIVIADKLFAEKSYDQAKVEYQKASGLKSSEQYPKTRLAETDKALSDIARFKAIDDQYNAAITGADKLLQDKSYDQAKTAYTEAGKIKAGEQYPKDKIVEINNILASIAKQKTLDEQYKTSIARADQLLVAKTYDQSKLEYGNALKIKPDEQYPKDKIAEIDVLLAEMKAKEDAYKASVAAADQLIVQKKFEEARAEYQTALGIKPQATYPKEKIAEINKALEELLGKQKYYENLVADADNSLKEKDYMKAKESYQQALVVFPAQVYPKKQIDLITARVDSLYRANKSLYDKAVADGDRFYYSFEFDKAVDAYSDAANFLPMEKYPREMIVKIRRTIAENAIADVLKSTVTITSNTEKQFPFPPVNIASRKNNFVYIKIRNLSGKPFNVLMRYGKDKQANGGVVMRNLNTDGKVNERLVSVRDQDLWSREDNNWISLYPQGGDIEVSFIQVSRAK